MTLSYHQRFPYARSTGGSNLLVCTTRPNIYIHHIRRRCANNILYTYIYIYMYCYQLRMCVCVCGLAGLHVIANVHDVNWNRWWYLRAYVSSLVGAFTLRRARLNKLHNNKYIQFEQGFRVSDPRCSTSRTVSLARLAARHPRIPVKTFLGGYLNFRYFACAIWNGAV